jgi:hypothetical protein
LHTLTLMYTYKSTCRYKNQPYEHNHIFFRGHFEGHVWDYVSNPDIFRSRADNILHMNNLRIVRIPVSHSDLCIFQGFHKSTYYFPPTYIYIFAA